MVTLFCVTTKYQHYAIIISLFFFLNVYLLYNTAQNTQIIEKLENRNDANKNELKSHDGGCEITDELAKSAISRAKSETCRKKLEIEACQLKNGTFTDKFPISLCSNHDQHLVDNRLGCYADKKESRVLTDFEYKFPRKNSKRMCRKHCYKAGFLHYGLEFGQECFCGNEIVNGTIVDDKQCQVYRCPASGEGEMEEFCGGFNAIEIFRTGLIKKLIPLKAQYLAAPEEPEQQEKKVKILFLLQLNGRNERQVKRFLKSIYLPHHYYYIHVDKRQQYMYSEMEKVAEKVKNIHVTSRRYSSIWGGASLLQMFQQVIRDLKEIEAFKDWDYIFNFSESDFPILPIKDFERLVSKNEGMSFLASHGYNTGKFIQKQGFEFVFSECDQRMFRIGKREFPENLRIDGGSDWVGIHRELAEYSISDDELPRKLRKMFESILLPLESFYHTLSFNSKFCDNVIMSNLRLTNWYRKQGCRCASLKAIVDWCGCSPLVFREETRKKFEIEKAKTKPTYFARKFDSMIDIESIESAEQQSVLAEHIQSEHPTYHFAFANIFKNGVDEHKEHFSSLAKYALQKVGFGKGEGAEPIRIERIDALRATNEADIEIVMGLKTADGQEIQFLIHRIAHLEFLEKSPEVEGYELKDMVYGTKFEWKEEICREYMGFVTDNDTLHIRLQWEATERVKKNGEKTSPNVEMRYRRAQDDELEHTKVKPYDSVFGGQFDSLDVERLLSSTNSSRASCEPILVDVLSPLAPFAPLATLRVPIYTAENRACHVELLAEFFKVQDYCRSEEECARKVWSTSHPDPKSDILFGYDEQSQRLR